VKIDEMGAWPNFKNGLKFAFRPLGVKELVEEDILPPKIFKSLSEYLEMHAQKSLVCTHVEDKIFIIFIFLLHHRYIPIIRLYP
jgi:hypothetical protein